VTFVAGDTASWGCTCTLVVPSDVLNCLLLQVALVASRVNPVPSTCKPWLSKPTYGWASQFSPQPLAPDSVRHVVITLRSLVVEDRVRIINSIMQEPSNEIPHLSWAYMLVWLNTIWHEPSRSISHCASPIIQSRTCSWGSGLMQGCSCCCSWCEIHCV